MHLKEALQKKLAYYGGYPYEGTVEDKLDYLRRNIGPHYQGPDWRMQEEINSLKSSLGETQDIAKGVLGGGLAGAGIGGSLAAALTWALMKNPKALDYFRNVGAGAALGGVAGTAAGAAAPMVLS